MSVCCQLLRMCTTDPFPTSAPFYLRSVKSHKAVGQRGSEGLADHGNWPVPKACNLPQPMKSAASRPVRSTAGLEDIGNLHRRLSTRVSNVGLAKPLWELHTVLSHTFDVYRNDFSCRWSDFTGVWAGPNVSNWPAHMTIQLVPIP